MIGYHAFEPNEDYKYLVLVQRTQEHMDAVCFIYLIGITC